MTAVEKLIISLESYYDVIAALAKLNKVKDLPEERNGEIVLEENAQGIELEFKEVNFSFDEHQNILSNINFKIPENSITVISGKLGAGKSLLLNMITGFYEPTSGSVLFDKIPLKNINKTELRNQIGLYLDDMTIIKGTVQENIVLGNKNISPESILDLAEEIGIENISSQFSAGFYTEISETDTEISFSSKKKILLLRSLLGNKRLLVLEDPLDGMNDEFRNKIMQYFHKIKKSTTIIIVSQDQNLLQLADQRLHLQNGTLEIV